MESRSSAGVTVSVAFYSYFKELTGCEKTSANVPPGTILSELFDELAKRFPKLGAMRKSTLMAVGVEYQPGSYVLRDGDEVSFFPPVQGG